MLRNTSPIMIVAFLAALASIATAQTPSIRLTADKTETGMGDSLVLTSTVGMEKGRSAEGYRVIPFVDGKRWGAIELTNSDGVATHLIPLPNPGPTDIQVLVHAPADLGKTPSWIWGDGKAEDTPRFFQKSFTFEHDPESAVLYVAVDDSATIFLNGVELGTVTGWQNAARFEELADYLTADENVLSIMAQSKGSLAGLLVRLESTAAPRNAVLVSDSSWRQFANAPYRWPFLTEEEGTPATVLSEVAWSPWRPTMNDWPALDDRSLDIVGTLLPAQAADSGDGSAPEGELLSAPLRVEVQRRSLIRPASNPEQRVGIQYEPWFTPHNATWGSASAIPLTGLYWSWNTDVIRQQMIWLIESGIDFLVVDWTNHLWDKTRWNDRDDRTNEIIHATTMLLDTLATMRDEGYPVPSVVLYTGLNNGPATTIDAVNEELEWIDATYVRNPRFTGLFEIYDEKPLILVHSGGGPDWKDETGASTLDDSKFTIRYQSSMHEFNDHAARGFWSWMDGSIVPVVTMIGDRAEALTVSTGFFARGGWKQDGALGRRGGWTLTESFKSALRHRPRFLQVHQYQEFAGQWEGAGYGPLKNVYVDSYSVELSDDIEPVSLSAHAYRGRGGWGFYYLNLLRALVDTYQQPEAETTVIALDHPGHGQEVTAATLPLRWTWVGRAPTGYRLEINGAAQEYPAEATEVEINLSEYPAGEVQITLTALGTRERYGLSYTEASRPKENMIEASVSAVLIHQPLGGQ